MGVSLAVCRAGAGAKKVSLYQHIADIAGVALQTGHIKLPLAMFNILEGGVHTNNKTGTGVQEFMVVPQKGSFRENLVVCNKVFNNLKEGIEKNFGAENLELGDEGGFAPPVSTAEQALFLLKAAIGEENAKIALDAAASEFYKDEKYINNK